MQGGGGGGGSHSAVYLYLSKFLTSVDAESFSNNRGERKWLSCGVTLILALVQESRTTEIEKSELEYLPLVGSYPEKVQHDRC